MKKINIKDIEINVDIIQVLNLFSMKKRIFIGLNAEITTDIKEINDSAIIAIIEPDVSVLMTNDAKTLALKLFENYKPTIVGTICKIKPVANWQKIIDYNKELMLYFDHQSDGVELFEDKLLEEYGWHATSLEISYRQISEYIEDNCEGLLLYYDNNVQFNGFVIVEDIEDVRIKVKNCITSLCLENLKNEIIDIEDDDVIEALEYFQIKV